MQFAVINVAIAFFQGRYGRGARRTGGVLVARVHIDCARGPPSGAATTENTCRVRGETLEFIVLVGFTMYHLACIHIYIHAFIQAVQKMRETIVIICRSQGLFTAK